MQPFQYANAGIAGLIGFGIFFYTLFNGMGQVIIITGAVTLLINALLSGFMALNSLRQGLLTAAAYCAPVAVFSALAVGDLVLKGKSDPFIFWFSAAAATFTAGALGVLVIFLYRLFRPKT